jgi:hypothetical protein
MSATPSVTRDLRPALFLDYGADAVDAETAACEVCERGMRFRSQWRFEVGAVLQIAFAFNDGTSQRIQVEGLVVDCAQDEPPIYRTTLAFVDAPAALKASLGKVSARLELSGCEGGSAPVRDQGDPLKR